MEKNIENKKLEALRHSAEHVLTMAMLRLWPGKIKAAMGPSTKDGFYFDFDSEIKITQDDFPKIEKEMAKIIKENLPIIKDSMTVKEARKFFSNNTYKGNEYKHEWIDDIEKRGQKVDVYWMGKKGKDIPETFVDICSGPHAKSTGEIQAFKLLSIAGAYWRGSEKNKMLTRIYGTAFPTKKELKQYLHMIEEAKKRDHRKLGKELDLFSFHEEAPGMVFLHSKGMIIWDELLDYWKRVHKEEGYQFVKTPIILNQKLWLQSGHWDHYKENMYFTKIDKEDYAVKPMNCPGGMLIYKTKVHSYKDFPLKVGEIGLVHRHELSGVLSGMLRVRSFHQDDAHIFCTEEQIEQESIAMIKLFDRIYKKFNLSYKVELSTRPEKAMGSKEMWDKAEKILESALKKQKVDYKINPGDGAFYGPKIDFHIQDAIGRTWQCGTIQLDYQMPEKFNLTYEGKDGKKHQPTMLHRAIYGAVERFLALLVEHYAGKFPTWLAPVQVVLMTVTDNHKEYGEKLKEEMLAKGIRVDLDDRSESIGKKVRDNQLQKVPYMITIGDKEVKTNNLAVRTQDGKVSSIEKKKFIDKVTKEIDYKNA